MTGNPSRTELFNKHILEICRLYNMPINEALDLWAAEFSKMLVPFLEFAKAAQRIRFYHWRTVRWYRDRRRQRPGRR